MQGSEICEGGGGHETETQYDHLKGINGEGNESGKHFLRRRITGLLMV